MCFSFPIIRRNFHNCHCLNKPILNNISVSGGFYELKNISLLQNITVYPAMNIILALKRPFIWLSRVRHRCGYGVHSPFAFELITCLFYEKTPYYAYKELAQEEKKQKRNHGKGWRNESLKVKRLLFRLVSRVPGCRIIDFGPPSSSSFFLSKVSRS